MSGMGGHGPFPPMVGALMGYAAEQRQLAGLGMAQSQQMADPQAQMGAMQPGQHISLTQDQYYQIFRSPVMPPDLPFGKPTKTVCAYCGGPDYEEKSCPGCGARTKEQRKCSG